MGKVNVQYDDAALRRFCERWKVREMCLFGSALREDFDAQSDVDILVSFAPEADWSWCDWMEMTDQIKEIFGREVDLVSRSAVERSENPYRKRHILSHLEPLYVA
ncbi:nucleotidyltransferase domain-containing protein [Candidatus Sumerlaeota bacterium]|nr:nucleotidyltransferase domain-containing protein [Candidatus Sumerlaeota bacterium]